MIATPDVGPPDMILRRVSDLNLTQNFQQIGFIPDELNRKPLTSEIELFLEKSMNPIIYMSMGTVFGIEPKKLSL